MKAASNESYGYTEDPPYSDIVGMSYGSLFDATQTKVLDVDGNNWLKLFHGNDNEMSYTAQLVRTLEYSKSNNLESIKARPTGLAFCYNKMDGFIIHFVLILFQMYLIAQ